MTSGTTARGGGGCTGERSRGRPRPRRRLAALVPLCLLAVAACGGDSRIVPPEIRDRWVAQGGRHDGLVLEITCRRVLVDAPDQIVSHLVVGVGVSRSRDDVHYDLRLLIDGGERDRLRLIRADDEPDVLRFRVGSESRFVRRPDAPAPWTDWDQERCGPSDRALPRQRNVNSATSTV